MKLSSNGTVMNATYPIMVEVFTEKSNFEQGLELVAETIADILAQIFGLVDYFQGGYDMEEDDFDFKRK